MNKVHFSPSIDKFLIEKIARIQKARIEGLKIEIETETSNLISTETQLSELENKGKNISDEIKKYQTQLNNLNTKYDNLKENIKDLNKVSKESEKELFAMKNVYFYILIRVSF